MSHEKLLDAVINNDAATTKILLEEGLSPNFSEDAAGITPLHFAAQNNSLDVVTLLVTAGARLDAKTEEGDTPLDIALRSKHQQMVTLLLKLMSYCGASSSC